MSRLDYLMKNYLNADSDKKTKKRKRKGGAEQGLVIQDDDASGWGNDSRKGRGNNDEDGYGRPVTVTAARSAEFRKAKNSQWKTLSGEPATFPPTTSSTTDNQQDDDAAAADAIIASAAAEARDDRQADDEAPVVAGEGEQINGDSDDDDDDGPVMESGARAGLQTAAQLSAQMERAARKQERKARKGKTKDDDEDDDAMALDPRSQQTVYRDASGRVVNVAAKRAELRAAAAAEEARRADELEERRGDVQKAEAARRREELRDARYLMVARYADDKDLNRELKERERWNDPMARFMSTTTKKEGGEKGGGGKPLYNGDAPPNRYGIRPGHRWDGVDRSNGFEKEYFAAQNRRKNVANLQYAWQLDE